ncbi:MAG: NAD(P)H-hydrate epimerase [Pirellulales bacterium]|nr:NAD(P)H-hydrate epimerase [Pirellulales bacterium]
MQILTRDQVREVDRKAMEDWGMSGLVLMENAGRGVAEIILHHISAAEGVKPPASSSQPNVAICCGAGNNGGDGFVIARHLQIAGVPAVVYMFAPAEKLPTDAAANYAIAQRAGIRIEDRSQHNKGNSSRADESSLAEMLSESDVIVDALLGTGARGNPRAPYDAAIRAINLAGSAGSWVVAVDVPSGLDCQTGEVGEPTVRADLTATFVAAKPGLVSESVTDSHVEDDDVKGHVGHLAIVSIGVPPALIAEISSEA